MRTISLSYNPATKHYALVNHPEFWEQTGRKDFFGFENLAKGVKELVGPHKGKKIQLNVDREAPAEVEDNLGTLLNQDYRVEFERVSFRR